MERIASAQIVLPCEDLDETLEFFTEQLGFLVESISPADDPAVAVVYGHGVRLRLDRSMSGPAGTIRLFVDGTDSKPAENRQLTAPNGTVVQFAEADPPVLLPPLDQRFAITRGGEGSWGVGRAGMRYRDLIPSREGGRFIASHIHIPDAGPVPDYVHFHRIRFQMIFVKSGWVKVVYEDQGPPFVMQAGDCVLQPPLIRHRVLESSANLEVVEIGSPAEHETLSDHQLELPTSGTNPGRDFGGQRYVRHDASAASWKPWRLGGFEARDTGISEATDGLADVNVVRSDGTAPPNEMASHQNELLFLMVLSGTLALKAGNPADTQTLHPDDAVTIPPRMPYSFENPSPELEMLEVRVL